MQLLERPAVFDESAGEPVEQLGMAGLVGPRSEIAGRANQSRAKMVRPDAVYYHASRERILRIDNRPRQLQSAAPDGKGLALGTRDNFNELPRNFFADVRRIASFEDVRRGWLLAVLEDDCVPG